MSLKIQPVSIFPSTAPAKDHDELPVPQKFQCLTEWCWAASTQMILRYYGNATVRQCDIATKHFSNGVDCCPKNPNCNKACDKDDISKIFTDWNLGSQEVDGPITFDKIQTEIHEERPVEIVIRLDSNSKHAEVIYGWQTFPTGNYVCINNPADGVQMTYYDDLCKGWRYTWIKIK